MFLGFKCSFIGLCWRLQLLFHRYVHSVLYIPWSQHCAFSFVFGPVRYEQVTVDEEARLAQDERAQTQEEAQSVVAQF
jgi:hypothetical protein